MATVAIANTTANVSGKTVVFAERDHTVTGLWTFDRDPSAPFAVSSGSAVVTNFDADKLDGQEGTYYTNATNLASGTIPAARFTSTGTASVETFFRGDSAWAVAFGQICQGRLTLTTAVPVTTADVTGAATVYFTPYGGNRIGLYNGTNWKLYTFSEVNIALGTITSGLPYDVFAYDSGGSVTLEIVAWTNTTTRATALATQDGVLSKTGSLTKRYLGSFFTTSTTTTEDSFANRYLYNHYNPEPRPFRVTESTDSWNYTTATFRQARATATNQLGVMTGVAGRPIEVQVLAHWANSGGQVTVYASIGEDSTSTPATGVLAQAATQVSATAGITSVGASLKKFPAAGSHTYVWLEYSTAVSTTTWYGDNGGTLLQSGIHGLTFQ